MSSPSALPGGIDPLNNLSEYLREAKERNGTGTVAGSGLRDRRWLHEGDRAQGPSGTHRRRHHRIEIGAKNIQGEEQQKLSTSSRNALLIQTPVALPVASAVIGSEEEDEVVVVRPEERRAASTACCSIRSTAASNIDVAAGVGTIFSILRNR